MKLLVSETNHNKQVWLTIALAFLVALELTLPWYWGVGFNFALGAAIECVKNFDDKRKSGEYGFFWPIRAISSYSHHNLARH